MKQSLFLKAAIVATILFVNVVPVLATEHAKESLLKPKPTVGEKLDDTVITAHVKMALLLHRSTCTFQTEITTNDGVVVIHGTVQNSGEKEFTTKLIEDIHGVKSVQNEMTIAKDTSSVGEKICDSAITAKVKMALALQRSTGALRTSVTTIDEVVTVSGKAKNSAEKELVSRVVEDIDGVEKVVNIMTIE